jgi:hypothetical protein
LDRIKESRLKIAKDLQRRAINPQELKGLLVVYKVKALQKGNKENTVKSRSKALLRLGKKADLNDPFEV